MNLPTRNNTCTVLLLIGTDRSYLPTRLLEINVKPLSKCLASSWHAGPGKYARQRDWSNRSFREPGVA